MLGVCDVCLTNSAHPERLLWPSLTCDPGQYNVVLMPATGQLVLSTGT